MLSVHKNIRGFLSATDLYILYINLGYDNFQVLDKCQLGDEVRKKENKLDSTG